MKNQEKTYLQQIRLFHASGSCNPMAPPGFSHYVIANCLTIAGASSQEKMRRISGGNFP